MKHFKNSVELSFNVTTDIYSIGIDITLQHLHNPNLLRREILYTTFFLVRMRATALVDERNLQIT